MVSIDQEKAKKKKKSSDKTKTNDGGIKKKPKKSKEEKEEREEKTKSLGKKKSVSFSGSKKKEKDEDMEAKEGEDAKPKKRQIPAWTIKTPYDVLVPKYMKSIVAENGLDTLKQDGDVLVAGVAVCVPSKERWLKKYAVKAGRSWHYVGPYSVEGKNGNQRRLLVDNTTENEESE